MLSLMFEVYILFNYEKIPGSRVRYYLLFNSIGLTMRLILICLINGMVFDEADKLFFTLDDINHSHLDEKAFKELMNFRTLSREIPNGFTIGGLLPLRRRTLLSVINVY